MNLLPLSPVARQNALARSVYRRLFRECQRIPPNTSLDHLDRWVGDTQIKDQDILLSCMRSSFRSLPSNEMQRKEGIQRALESLKYMLSLDMHDLIKQTTAAHGPLRSKDESESTTKEENLLYTLKSQINSDNLLQSVQWLPRVSEMEASKTESSVYPIFPLGGPLFPDDKGIRLPLLSQFSEAPVFGMEIPLRIFEPRYRKMYQDLLSSPDASSRRFIVPFPHPYQPGQFAAYGWMYEIVRVKDIADESNGKIQLLCNHLVTKPIKIHGIVNPEDYKTHLTYLRARADILHDGDEGGSNHIKATKSISSNHTKATKSMSEDLKPIEELLRELQNQPLSLISDNTNRKIDTSLINRLLFAAGEGSIWPVVQVWISNMQTEILRVQMKISTRIQLQAKIAQQQSIGTDNFDWQEYVTQEMVCLAQQPYKSHLKSMLIEVSTLIPWLLQQESHKAQCQLMCERIRERLVNETERS